MSVKEHCEELNRRGWGRTMRKEQALMEQYRERARRAFMVDPQAPVRLVRNNADERDRGAWVMAWVWIAEPPDANTLINDRR
jgi:hypothetical protein